MQADFLANRSFSGIGLTARRGGRQLFSGLEFSLAPGGVLLLLGANGTGKSSFLRLMAGLGRPVAGQLLWGQHNISDDLDAHRVRLHLLGYQDGIKPALTVEETLKFWLRLAASTSTPIEHALEALGIGRLAKTSCQLMSTGQRRRLALARLVASPRPLWLLDEPTVGLDTGAVAGLTRLIRQHCQAGGMAVIATHQEIDLPDTLQLSLADYPPQQTIDPLLAEIW